MNRCPDQEKAEMAMCKAVLAQEDREASGEKAAQVARKPQEMKLRNAAAMVMLNTK